MSPKDVDPIESVRIIQETLKKVRRHLSFGSGPVYKVWGLTWIVGFVLTDLVVRGPLHGKVPEAFISVIWIALTTMAGAYTFRYFRRHPVETQARLRFFLAWFVAFTLMGVTVGGMASLGLMGHGIHFALWALFTIAVIFIVTGALLFDNVQMITGLWLGIANVAALLMGVEHYPLAIALLGGGGLLIAGFVDDWKHTPVGETP